MRHRTFHSLYMFLQYFTFFFPVFLDDEYEWKGPFYFIQGADPQFGLIKAWAVGDTNNGDDEWKEEIKLTEQAVQAVNKLNPKPKFFVLCGDLIHGMPGKAIKSIIIPFSLCFRLATRLIPLTLQYPFIGFGILLFWCLEKIECFQMMLEMYQAFKFLKC